MRNAKWMGLIAVIVLIAACFIPWIFIEYKNITITGMNTEGTNYGKPGLFNLVFAAFFLVFNFINTIWAKRMNLFMVVLNIAWSVRNFFMLSICHAGECPEKKLGIYLVLISSIVMLVVALFPDIKLNKPKTT